MQEGEDEHDECFDLLACLLDENSSLHQNPNSHSGVSFDMWGSCTPRNFSKTIRRTNCLKPIYRDLIQQVVNLCRNAGVEMFVYAGTALGVYREGGNMVAFDYDADFATLEYADGDPSGCGHLSKLANYSLLDTSVLVTHVENLEATCRPDATLQVDFANSLGRSAWVYADSSGVIHEHHFDGDGAKRAKFKLTAKGMRDAAAKAAHMNAVRVEQLVNNLGDIHVDLFTLSPHPQSPIDHLRVNWHRPGIYDSLRKMFLRHHLFPLQESTFEDLSVLAPVDLAGYLTTEYGYIGRDAIYDAENQCYVKIPPERRNALPAAYLRYISETNSVSD